MFVQNLFNNLNFGNLNLKFFFVIFLIEQARNLFKKGNKKKKFRLDHNKCN